MTTEYLASADLRPGDRVLDPVIGGAVTVNRVEPLPNGRLYVHLVLDGNQREGISTPPGFLWEVTQ